jgi:hypothetical protein
LQNKLFDHKAVTLKLNKKMAGKIGIPTISKKDLEDDLLPFLVHATVAESYLLQCGENIPNIDLLINTCGTLKALIRDCGPPFELRVEGDYTDQDKLDRARKLVHLQILVNNLDIATYEHINLTCTADIFLESLLLNIKNEVISHQAFIRKKKSKKLLQLEKIWNY